MKSITPNTSVRPAAIRNKRTPSCNPFKTWTRKSVPDMELVSGLGPAVAPPQREARASSVSRIGRAAGCRGGAADRLLHRTVLRVRVAVFGEHGFDDFGLIFAVRAFGDFGQIKILDRIVVVVEREAAAQRLELGFLERRAQRVLVGEVAFDRAHG